VQSFYQILQNNRAWVGRMTGVDPQFFTRLSEGQSPTFLFIGCADSRVPANEITGTGPGDMFVHRNIANQAFNNDLNLLSVLQYAVDVLQVRHVIVCGHYGCGGVKAGCEGNTHGLVDHWLSQVRELQFVHRAHLDALPDDDARHKRMVQLNVLRQVRNLASTPILQLAWERGRRPYLHGLVYDLADGILDPLVVGMDSFDDCERALHDLWAVSATHAASQQPLVFAAGRPA
jgi:carbonic anhydrase